MNEQHPNVEILKQFDPERGGAFADDIIFHFYNPHLPDLHGDYAGPQEVRTFFKKLRAISGGEFRPNVVSINPIGDELVVVHRTQAINMDGHRLKSDVVVVFRIVNGKIGSMGYPFDSHGASPGELTLSQHHARSAFRQKSKLAPSDLLPSPYILSDISLRCSAAVLWLFYSSGSFL